MKPTDELSQEHRAIFRIIRIIGKMASRLEAGIAVDLDDLDQAVEFIQIFTHKCHHIKEEDHLYAEIIRSGTPGERVPIDLMITEHVEVRKYFAAMVDAIEGLRKGNRKPSEIFAAGAHSYGKLLTQHIFKEDHILYPMARTRLSHAQQTLLNVRFAEVDKNVLGADRREEFNRLLERLEQTYPD